MSERSECVAVWERKSGRKEEGRKKGRKNGRKKGRKERVKEGRKEGRPGNRKFIYAIYTTSYDIPPTGVPS